MKGRLSLIVVIRQIILMNDKFLDNYKDHNHYDFQGFHMGTIISSSEIPGIKVGGLSEEYFPGTGSDPDFNKKLWDLGIRIFKGINKFQSISFLDLLF